MISLMFAMARNRVIGKNNDLPWRLRSDLVRFKEYTKGHTVIMGRKTYDSIIARLKKPLPERTTIVITRQQDFTAAEGCIVVHSWEEAKKHCTDKEVFILGGEEIYKLALPDADKLYVTTVEASVGGDAFFPQFDTSQWKVEETETVSKGEKDEYDSTFEILTRR